MEVVGVVERESAVVVVRRCWSAVCRVSSTRRKGRYLLASEICVGAVSERVREGVPFVTGFGPLRVSLGFVVCGFMEDEGVASPMSMSEDSLAALCCGAVPFSVAEEGVEEEDG